MGESTFSSADKNRVKTSPRGDSACRHLRVEYLGLDEIKADPTNPQEHSLDQIRALARSMKAFDFNVPILVDKNNKIVAGHCRYEAARLAGYSHVPVIRLDHLTEAKAKAFMVADNKIAQKASWNEAKLRTLLKELSEIALDFEIEDTGFEAPEIDFYIQSPDLPEFTDSAEEFNATAGPSVSQQGDLWILRKNRLYCGTALERGSFAALLENEKATAAFTDPPYNVRINGHVSGKGQTSHREFPMASGEMSEAEFTEFLAAIFLLLCAHLIPGALIYSCMDWRHMGEMDAAAQAAGYRLLNLCVWVKTNAGMGSFYRSQHEFIYVFRNGKAAHLNNVQLGRFGRNRTNVWNYAGANTFGRKNFDFHPTVKPIRMVADAILDSTKRNDIVLDPFLGSGTTLLAAERTGRRCYGIELDPLYVDTTIERWQKMTGLNAHNRLGESYDAVKARRTANP